MAGHSHDEHHMAGPKPVSFTVPFILAAVTLLILFMFLSLCDPKSHHDAAGHESHGVENTAHSEFKGEANHEEHAAGQSTEPAKSEAAPEAATSSEPEAEAAHH